MNRSDLQRRRGDLRHRGDRTIWLPEAVEQWTSAAAVEMVGDSERKRQPAAGWANPRCGRGLVKG